MAANQRRHHGRRLHPQDHNQRGHGEEKPAWGNKVKVHYVGTLTSNGEKFDSSRDRNSPFDFKLGSGVITGWSEAVPTMLPGEIAKFTISSEKSLWARRLASKNPAERVAGL